MDGTNEYQKLDRVVVLLWCARAFLVPREGAIMEPGFSEAMAIALPGNVDIYQCPLI